MSTGEKVWVLYIDGKESGPFERSELVERMVGVADSTEAYVLNLSGIPPEPIRSGSREFAEHFLNKEEDSISNAATYNDSNEGIVDFYNDKDKYGFILVKGKPELTFYGKEFKSGKASSKIKGLEVRFQVRFDSEKRTFRAVDVRLVDEAKMPVLPEPSLIDPKKYREDLRLLARNPKKKWQVLGNWSTLRVDATARTNPDTQLEYTDDPHIPLLADMATDEAWGFPHQSDRLCILRSYLRYTFYKLVTQNRVVFTEKYAAFNTGLVDDLYDPIHALFQRQNNWESKKYRFMSFCTPGGRDYAVRTLLKEFRPLPEAPSYITEFDHVIFDHHVEMTMNWDHIMQDAIAKGRYPREFLRKNMPVNFNGNLFDERPQDWLPIYVACLENDLRTKRDIKSRLEAATDVAVKRAQWNYKTAIPCYFPTLNTMSLLLPIALLDDNRPDLALVVERIRNEVYRGVTVYPLTMAYTSARLVCKQDSDWLRRENVDEQSLLSLEEDER